ncbi:unnamed protein product [Notodromas monacha]|uniref:Methyltransferase FkbM domain-containing protein n=1 Tax=Notodromas monacha TaxID=399045 RepID=A0A7R9BCQ0_9CRUS|nr:unnamed protein product [Notodromas monacha]CAG0912358.1 unnamed protein product [Notodromas monacha]
MAEFTGREPTEGWLTQEIALSQADGVFVEAGAYNGEELSNSLFFEKERGWSGLLIEPDPWNYYALRKRNRNARSIQCCLSKELLGQTIDFKQSDTMGRVVTPEEKKSLPGIYTKVKCFPLGLVLIAAGIRRVDLLSLDIEGRELEVLSHFPFDENL